MEDNNDQNEHARVGGGGIGSLCFRSSEKKIKKKKEKEKGQAQTAARRNPQAGLRCLSEGATPAAPAEAPLRSDSSAPVASDRHAVKPDGPHAPTSAAQSIGVAMFGADVHFTVGGRGRSRAPGVPKSASNTDHRDAD